MVKSVNVHYNNKFNIYSSFNKGPENNTLKLYILYVKKTFL